jgi:glycerol-3-phosphate dehydrogenase (NAD(P)+)
MQITRYNTRHLPDVRLPDSVIVSSDLETISPQSPVLLSVPMQQLRSVVAHHKETLRGHALVACCKGIELDTGLNPSEVTTEILPENQTALLSGPSFAADIARGLPTALTLAFPDEAENERLQARLQSPNLRLYRSTDMIGVALGGALKNVMAIACGAAIGAGLGESARAALMTRGYAEMQRMAMHLGAQAGTLAGLSGFGDLTLTCTSEKSRNYRLGLSLGTGDPFDPTITVEGAATARAMTELANQKNIDMPITEMVVALLEGRYTAAEAANALLSRPLREE